jgi:hypothetical protein
MAHSCTLGQWLGVGGKSSTYTGDRLHLGAGQALGEEGEAPESEAQGRKGVSRCRSCDHCSSRHGNSGSEGVCLRNAAAGLSKSGDYAQQRAG